MWQQWINAILGVFVLLIPFLTLSNDTRTTVLIILGALITILALWGAASYRNK